MRNEMFEFVQFPAGIIKRLVAKATNAVIMSGLGIGIGSALLLSLLKHIFRKARTLEVLSPPENEDEPSQKDDSPLVFLITQKKSKCQSELESSCLISSPSSSSNSSMSLLATDTHVSEMELKPLPELMLLDDESLRDKLKDDYIVLVVSPRKSDVNHHGDEDNDNDKTTPSHVVDRENESLRNVRSSFDVSINRILNNSLKRFRTPQLQAREERKGVLGDHDDNGNFRDCETASEPGEEGCSGSFSLAKDMSLISTATADSAYLLTSAEMRSIFEGEQISSDSLFGNLGNSDVMKKLADIEEKLCLVHVDTDDMMSYINAVKRSEKISAILSRPQYVCFDHPITSTPSNGSLVDRPSFDHGAEFMLDLDLNEDLSAADDPKNFDEWSFEDQLGDPNDISF